MSVWFSIACVCIIGELFIPRMIFIWFGVAALITLMFSNVISNDIILCIFFLVSSLILLVLMRSVSKKYAKKDDDVNLKKIIDKEVTIKNIDANNNYVVNIAGRDWEGKSGQVLSVNDKCRIIKYNGAYVILEKIIEVN